jgi:hypothetical protein
VKVRVTEKAVDLAVTKLAKEKFTTPEEQQDYILPDSSNAAVNSANSINNKLVGNVSNRISVKSSGNKLSVPNVGISSGEVAENLEIWSSFGYQRVTEDKPKDDQQQDYSKVTAKIFSAGFDTNLTDNIFVGLSYGYSKADVKVFGNLTGITKATADIDTNAVVGYIADVNNMLTSSLAVAYANNKHKSKETDNTLVKYDSNVIGATADFSHDFDLTNRFASILNLNAKFAVARVHTDEHENKYGTTVAGKYNNFVTIAIGSAISKQLKLAQNKQLNYKAGIAFQHVITNGDTQEKIDIIPNDATSTVGVKMHKPDDNMINLNLALDFMLNKNISLELDSNYNFSKNTKEYGVVAGIRYHF